MFGYFTKNSLLNRSSFFYNTTRNYFSTNTSSFRKVLSFTQTNMYQFQEEIKGYGKAAKIIKAKSPNTKVMVADLPSNKERSEDRVGVPVNMGVDPDSIIQITSAQDRNLNDTIQMLETVQENYGIVNILFTRGSPVAKRQAQHEDDLRSFEEVLIAINNRSSINLNMVAAVYDQRFPLTGSLLQDSECSIRYQRFRNLGVNHFFLQPSFSPIEPHLVDLIKSENKIHDIGFVFCALQAYNENYVKGSRLEKQYEKYYNDYMRGLISFEEYRAIMSDVKLANKYFFLILFSS